MNNFNVSIKCRLFVVGIIMSCAVDLAAMQLPQTMRDFGLLPKKSQDDLNAWRAHSLDNDDKLKSIESVLSIDNFFKIKEPVQNDVSKFIQSLVTINDLCSHDKALFDACKSFNVMVGDNQFVQKINVLLENPTISDQKTALLVVCGAISNNPKLSSGQKLAKLRQTEVLSPLQKNWLAEEINKATGNKFGYLNNIKKFNDFLEQSSDYKISKAHTGDLTSIYWGLVDNHYGPSEVELIQTIFDSNPFKLFEGVLKLNPNHSAHNAIYNIKVRLEQHKLQLTPSKQDVETNQVLDDSQKNAVEVGIAQNFGLRKDFFEKIKAINNVLETQDEAYLSAFADAVIFLNENYAQFNLNLNDISLVKAILNNKSFDAMAQKISFDAWIPFVSATKQLAEKCERAYSKAVGRVAVVAAGLDVPLSPEKSSFGVQPQSESRVDDHVIARQEPVVIPGVVNSTAGQYGSLQPISASQQQWGNNTVPSFVQNDQQIAPTYQQQPAPIFGYQHVDASPVRVKTLSSFLDSEVEGGPDADTTHAILVGMIDRLNNQLRPDNSVKRMIDFEGPISGIVEYRAYCNVIDNWIITRIFKYINSKLSGEEKRLFASNSARDRLYQYLKPFDKKRVEGLLTAAMLTNVLAQQDNDVKNLILIINDFFKGGLLAGDEVIIDAVIQLGSFVENIRPDNVFEEDLRAIVRNEHFQRVCRLIGNGFSFEKKQDFIDAYNALVNRFAPELVSNPVEGVFQKAVSWFTGTRRQPVSLVPVVPLVGQQDNSKRRAISSPKLSGRQSNLSGGQGAIPRASVSQSSSSDQSSSSAAPSGSWWDYLSSFNPFNWNWVKSIFGWQ